MDFREEMINMIMDTCMVNRKVAEIVFAQAYEDGHYAGEHEVENYCIDYGYFAQNIIEAARG